MTKPFVTRFMNCCLGTRLPDCANRRASISEIRSGLLRPGIDGYFNAGSQRIELPGHVRQKYPDTPVIIISGISDQEHAQGLIRLGAFEFLLKPFRLEVLEKSVKRAPDRRRYLLQAPRSANETSEEATDWKIIRVGNDGL